MLRARIHWQMAGIRSLFSYCTIHTISFDLLGIPKGVFFSNSLLTQTH